MAVTEAGLETPARVLPPAQAFAQRYVDWMNGSAYDTDAPLDKLSEIMSDETWEKFSESMQTLADGEAMFYSDEERKAFQEPIMEVLKLLEEEMSQGNGMGDVPADWWTNTNNNGLTSEDISGFRGLPNMMAKSVQNGISGIKVTMDGYAVGKLVAPYVSQEIAKEMN